MFAAMRVGQISLREPDDENNPRTRPDREIAPRKDFSTKAPRAKQKMNMIESDTTHASTPLSERRRTTNEASTSTSDAAPATRLSPRPVLIRNDKKR